MEDFDSIMSTEFPNGMPRPARRAPGELLAIARQLVLDDALVRTEEVEADAWVASGMEEQFKEEG